MLSEGRLRTGDVGYLDGEGYLFLVDRIKDIIIAGGYKIYPRNVEEAIYQNPKVAECIVISIDDPYRGQTVKAYVAPSPGASSGREGAPGFSQGQALADRDAEALRVPPEPAEDPHRQAVEESADGRGSRAPRGSDAAHRLKLFVSTSAQACADRGSGSRR